MRRCLLYTAAGLVDAIVGYRGWKGHIENGGVELTSTTRVGYVWPPGAEVEALCSCEVSHTCGIHAYSEPILPYTPKFVDASFPGCPPGSRFILGEVLLWGTVRKHERGYRAQYGKPSAFYVTEAMHKSMRHFIELAALQHDVPVVLV